MNLNLNSVAIFLFTVLRISTPLIFASLSAVITKQAGLLNLAIESMMLSAALSGVIVSGITQSAWLGVIGGLLTAVLIALTICYAAFIMKCDLYLVSISMNTALVGGTVFIMYLFTGKKSNTIGLIASKTIGKLDIPVIKDIPFIGDVISGHNIMTYCALLIIFLTWFIIYKTRTGLRIRSVGENPLAAESVGISSIKIYFISFGLSGIIAGLGGVYMSMGLLSYFSRDMIAGRGMIGVSAMRVADGSPVGSSLFAVLFGISDTVANYLQITNMPPQLISMFPYAATIILMVVLAVLQNYRYTNHLKSLDMNK